MLGSRATSCSWFISISAGAVWGEVGWTTSSKASGLRVGVSITSLSDSGTVTGGGIAFIGSDEGVGVTDEAIRGERKEVVEAAGVKRPSLPDVTLSTSSRSSSSLESSVAGSVGSLSVSEGMTTSSESAGESGQTGSRRDGESGQTGPSVSIEGRSKGGWEGSNLNEMDEFTS